MMYVHDWDGFFVPFVGDPPEVVRWPHIFHNLGYIDVVSMVWACPSFRSPAHVGSWIHYGYNHLNIGHSFWVDRTATPARLVRIANPSETILLIDTHRRDIPHIPPWIVYSAVYTRLTCTSCPPFGWAKYPLGGWSC